MSAATETHTDLDRLRAWLDENPYGTGGFVFTDGCRARDDALRSFAIELSVSVRYALDDQQRSDAEKLERIGEFQAAFERNCAEAKAAFSAWMGRAKSSAAASG